MIYYHGTLGQFCFLFVEVQKERILQGDKEREDTAVHTRDAKSQ